MQKNIHIIIEKGCKVPRNVKKKRNYSHKTLIISILIYLSFMTIKKKQ